MRIATSPIASSLGGAEIKDLCVHGGQNVLKLASSFYTGVLKRKIYLNVKRPILQNILNLKIYENVLKCKKVLKLASSFTLQSEGM